MFALLLLAAALPMNDIEFDAARALAPADVRSLIDRWDGCDHWSGEEAYDKDRARQIDRAFKSLRCDRLPRDAASIGARYAGRPAVQRLIEAARARCD
jgi:hypothetical protein